MDCTFDEEIDEVVTTERGPSTWQHNWLLQKPIYYLTNSLQEHQNKITHITWVDIWPLQTLLSPLCKIRNDKQLTMQEGQRVLGSPEK
jgi:hypothetical protein